ncbi:trimeric LpxA-like protein [Exophiala viscosa]|uniref:Dynactin subunit 6 n=1 Tax=Exophiala viscosa TaxID=2486360 RepID=A0AAN6IB49_9EURO|nr:trimeric LpxA-like protein [Exophiala viscosa]KAI1628677.1 trimeric LpxA-like protein [Exophiala viscosa]
MSTQAAQPAPQSTSSSRPPVSLGQTTHLDPGAYVRGSHAITLGEHSLVHPRAHLVAIHGPISIGDGCIISEKCVIGGPVQGSASPGLPQSPETEHNESDPSKTTIGANVYIQANAQIHAGATIQDAVLIEAHAVVLLGVTVGSHAKVCAGVTLERDLEDWAVVYGHGDVKRSRKPSADAGAEQADLVETVRLKAMDKEREGTAAILKLASRMASVAKKK